MRVTSLSLVDFRNFKVLKSEFAEGVNVIYGPNAAGKTNLIEAIYYLSLARSFKKADDKDLVRIGAAQGQVLMKYFSEADGPHTIEATLAKGGKTIVFDNEKVPSVMKIVGKLLCLVYSPLTVSLLRGEPAERRRFLDTVLSLLSSQYLYALARQKRLLKERNTALGQNYDEDVIAVLTDELCNVSYRICLDRKAFIMSADAAIGSIYDKLFQVDDKVHLVYQSDVPDAISQEAFVSEMKKKFDLLKSEERLRKTTLLGVQRDDMLSTIDGKDVYAYASQGQNRLAALALILTAGSIIGQHFKEKPILLLDDVMSDLDETRRKSLYEFLKTQGQVFITATDKPETDEKMALYEIADGQIERR
jgi:DNA replication and repair protein RecF